MFAKSVCFELMENYDKNSSAHIWEVFRTREHFDS